MNDVSRTPHIQSRRKYEILPHMAKLAESLSKFVRLKLTGEIVEVADFYCSDIIVNYKGKELPLAHHEVSWLTREEAAALAERRISG
jgi:hypothetical protein